MMVMMDVSQTRQQRLRAASSAPDQRPSHSSSTRTLPCRELFIGDIRVFTNSSIHATKAMVRLRQARAFCCVYLVNRLNENFQIQREPGEGWKSAVSIADLFRTGEGGVSSHHLKGGDLVWQVGTGYFGCREPDGRFSMAKLKDTIARAPQIRAIEMKLSQGAKPGVGGLLPRVKIRREIAEIRDVPMDRDCVSRAAHSVFRNADEMLDFIELIASETGLPVGIKSAVGDFVILGRPGAINDEVERAVSTSLRSTAVKVVQALAPLVFTDHVALPFKVGFSRVQKICAEQRAASSGFSSSDRAN